MKYSVGQKVKIRSLEWYRDNVNRYGIIECGKYEFFEPMNEYCGKVVTIKRIDDDNYRIDTDKGAFCWTDEMIEGLVEEEIKPKFKVGDKITNGKATLTILTLTPDRYVVEDAFGECGSVYFKSQDEWKIVEEKSKPKYEDEVNEEYYSTPKYLVRPSGYQFVDENGNVINAKKIVLEKKKKDESLTQEQINAVVHDSSASFCKHCGCGVPRETCTSLGTCKEYDDYRKYIRTYLEKHKK